jgi:hypothetical protein
MNNRNPLSLSSKLTVLGLLVAAAGISTLFLTTSVAVPAIPVGPILLLAIAALIGLGRWRWTPIVGVVMSIALLVGALIAPGLFDRLSDPAHVGAFVGTWVQMLGVFTAIIAGTLATIQNYRPQSAILSR